MPELAEQLEQGFENINKKIDANLEKQTEQIQANGEAAEETKQELEKLQEQHKELIEKHSERLSNLEKANNRLQANGKDKPVTFGSLIVNAINDNNEKIKAFSAGDIPSLNLQINAASDMTEGDNLSGDVIEPTRLPGVKHDPESASHVRQFIPQVATTSNSISYTKESAFTDGTKMTAEGAQKGQSDLSLSQETADVSTCAAILRLSKQMFDDVPFLKGYLNQRLPVKLFKKEDNQILYGDGTSPNIGGFSKSGNNQAYSEILDSDEVQNRIDVITNAIAQAMTANGEYSPNAVLINALDWFNMSLARDDNNDYLMPDAVRMGAQAFTIAGVKIAKLNAVTSDDFFVGDFNAAATFAARENVNLRFFEQDKDNVQKNMITARIEERFGLPIHNPNAVVYGDFTSALST
jgi:HK97 family phage major capsid protein